MHRWMVVAAVALIATAALALGDAGRLAARERARWQDLVAPRAPRAGGGEPTQRPIPVLPHAAADRLREALAAAQDDPKTAAKIERLIAQAAAEARRNRALADRVWYWRDPFSENPRQPIVLSLEVQLEMQVAAARQEAARARVESAAARQEAAAALAEAARARAAVAHVQSTKDTPPARAAERNRAVATIAKPITRPPNRTAPPPAPPSDSEPTPAELLLPARTRVSAGGGPAVPPVRRRAPRFYSAKTALARNERAAPSGGSRHRDVGPAPAVAAPPPTVVPITADADPATWSSNDPRGIVVVPINTSVAHANIAPLARHR